MEMESSTSSTPTTALVVVGISLQEEESKELLSWAMSVAACPGDTLVALHVLVEKHGRESQFMKARIDNARAMLIKLLGSFMDLWQAKQIKVEAKVLVHSSLEKAIVNEAATSGASFLVLGASTYQLPSPSIGVTKKYCLEHAPAGCAVIAVKDRRDVPLQELFPRVPETDCSEILTDCSEILQEGNHWFNLKWPAKEVGKTLGSLQKKLLSKIQSRGEDEFRNHVTEGYESFQEQKEKHSPRGVLEAPSHCLDQEESFSSESSIGSSPFRNDGDDRSTSEESPHNCFNFWTTASMQSNKFLKLFSLSFGHCTTQLTSTAKNHKDPQSLFPRNRENFEERRAYEEMSWKPTWRSFTYKEISYATNNFNSDNLVGKGGYAEVYKGVLSNGKAIAVKTMVNGATDEQKEKDFLTELGIIGHIHHPNTASLLGCCIENGLHLIFHFSPNGSLDSYLHDTNTPVLEWSIRYKVAVGIARGLHYLHKCCRRRIIHRDIKAANILLGREFEPQISDFGLAKWLPRQWTHHSVTPIEGTYGYLAPEYFMHGIVDEKTDVFAFGVLLLEIVSGRKPFDTSEENILVWAKPLLESGNIKDLADPRLECQYDIVKMKRVLFTASLCIRHSAIWRPSMSEALQLLTDGESLLREDCWRIPSSKDDAFDDYWDELHNLRRTAKR
ncbi:hypothetical protein SUGI_0580750 [Cryptomeria japonica]|uniref:probable receptor-like serine/threonine-protein kinase At5g57670 n=1 Tax=Cryptomeria japonica TaxID=3369 RepID=UPI002414BDF5|nr:probable receptor-like serine/threonine-protein kinase At5g57670 [Cryptomeria japonica]GLJ29461.1 hypothetical protein SUGI_0580750 [Cryptomeria japonica]